MHFTSHSLLPENQQPLMITVAPFGPHWLPADSSGGLAVPWKNQIQMAVDCYNAGATILHVQVRDPKTGLISNNLKEYGEFIGMLRHAVPKMILQVGGPIPFASTPSNEAGSHESDTQHLLTDIDPKPDQVTVRLGDDAEAYFIEHLKRFRARSIQPCFSMAHLHHLDELGHVIHTGVYMGPVNHVLTAVDGSALCRRNPLDFIEYVRRSPPGSVTTMECAFQTIAPFAAMAIALGVHVRCGMEDDTGKGGRMTSVQQVDQIVRIAKVLRRTVTTADEAREMLKLGSWYNSVEDTLDALWASPIGRVTN